MVGWGGGKGGGQADGILCTGSVRFAVSRRLLSVTFANGGAGRPFLGGGADGRSVSGCGRWWWWLGAFVDHGMGQVRA